MEQSAPSSEQPAAIPSLAAPAVERQPGTGRGAVRFAGAIVMALVLHGAALAALIAAIDATSGEGGKSIDVVEVSLVSADALAPGNGRSAAITGGSEATARAEAAPSPDAGAASGAAPSVDQAPVVRAETAAQPADMTLPAAADGIDAPVRLDTGATPVEPTGSTSGQAASTASEPSSTASTQSPTRDEAAAAAPSDGEVDAYNRTVAVTLAKLKPRGIGEAGLAKIVFRIGSTGSVDDVKLAVSTGKSKLDRLATDTVARAKFEVPPAGMTTAQLTYAIAFRFR